MTIQQAKQMIIDKFPNEINAEFSRDEDGAIDIDTLSIIEMVFSKEEVSEMSDETIGEINEFIIAKTSI